ncbi:hypothetical protein GE09DRAFT_1184547 [Coniochaeta sp. 2T2.1]|nr:hypothetical protein GE09DRAFT_1184547 [Coniochaeta sp. 2T2.1]
MGERDIDFDIGAEAGLQALSAATHGTARKTRVRNTTACNACRERRTKCDSRRPACGYCRSRGLNCSYDQKQASSASRVEAELAAINRRLDYIAGSLPLIYPPPSSVDPGYGTHSDTNRDDYTDAVTDKQRHPFQLLLTDCIMTVVGLGPGFTPELLRLERSTPCVDVGVVPKLLLMQQQNALAALSAFSVHVHIWYPFLRPGFSAHYAQVISGPLTPCPETCLVLAVAAVGALVQHDHALGAPGSDNSSKFYQEAAVASLPAVLVSGSIESVQSLFLLSLYYCCLSKPCQAYDYVVIASLKVQNLLRHAGASTGQLYEQMKRCYWAILLLESELRNQLDLVDSGIWDLDDRMALPDGRHTWHFDHDGDFPQNTTTASNIGRAPADTADANRCQVYFLAEIAMRRMLHRSCTAIRTTPLGEVAYAPSVALELELQLDEWYCYLPDMFHFENINVDISALSPSLPNLPPDPLKEFLRVQYYCCKMSIYWPAAYQCVQDGVATPEVLGHCERFFNAYIQAMPSMLLSLRACIVNRWTLYSTIFVNSMAVIHAAGTAYIRQGCAVDWSSVVACLESIQRVDSRIVEASPSLSLLHGTLMERVKEMSASLRRTAE